MRVLRLVAVVEGEDDRLARRQRRAFAPVREQLVHRDRVIAGFVERAHLPFEFARLDVEAREGGAAGGALITWYMRIGAGRTWRAVTDPAAGLRSRARSCRLRADGRAR